MLQAAIGKADGDRWQKKRTEPDGNRSVAPLSNCLKFTGPLGVSNPGYAFGTTNHRSLT
jgi:hypothetical protein